MNIVEQMRENIKKNTTSLLKSNYDKYIKSLEEGGEDLKITIKDLGCGMNKLFNLRDYILPNDNLDYNDIKVIESLIEKTYNRSFSYFKSDLPRNSDDINVIIKDSYKRPKLLKGVLNRIQQIIINEIDYLKSFECLTSPIISPNSEWEEAEISNDKLERKIRYSLVGCNYDLRSVFNSFITLNDLQISSETFSEGERYGDKYFKIKTKIYYKKVFIGEIMHSDFQYRWDYYYDDDPRLEIYDNKKETHRDLKNLEDKEMHTKILDKYINVDRNKILFFLYSLSKEVEEIETHDIFTQIREILDQYIEADYKKQTDKLIKKNKELKEKIQEDIF